MDLWTGAAFLIPVKPFLWELHPEKGGLYVLFSLYWACMKCTAKCMVTCLIFVLCVCWHPLVGGHEAPFPVARRVLWVPRVWQMTGGHYVSVSSMWTRVLTVRHKQSVAFLESSYIPTLYREGHGAVSALADDWQVWWESSCLLLSEGLVCAVA